MKSSQQQSTQISLLTLYSYISPHALDLRKHAYHLIQSHHVSLIPTLKNTYLNVQSVHVPIYICWAKTNPKLSSHLNNSFFLLKVSSDVINLSELA